jgi:L-seryl-tRNA(Ser) seleniumtransferase
MSDRRVSEQRVNIPSVNKVMNSDALQQHRDHLEHNVFKTIIQKELEELRTKNSSASCAMNEEDIVNSIKHKIDTLLAPVLKGVINATGVVLHTNLGRAPWGDHLYEGIRDELRGYSNLEFDLDKGQRSNRNDHLRELIKLFSGGEDCVAVNNNAAAVYLMIKALAENKEIIVSRGELVEIGGSFRIPDIIAASGAKMIEIGTTNKTKLSDYERAIISNTAMILKVHKSNYYIKGFTAEVSVAELASLAKKHDLLICHDFGTGLPSKTLLSKVIREGESESGADSSSEHKFDSEPDLKQVMNEGADLVTFSCDKLLGGPQAGIITGRRDLVQQIAKHPLMRIMRVDKLTIALLVKIMQTYLLKAQFIKEAVPVYSYLNRSQEELQSLAGRLAKLLQSEYIRAEIIPSKGRCGGGALPDYYLNSKAVSLEFLVSSKAKKVSIAEKIHKSIRQNAIKPVLAILKEGKLIIDLLALSEDDITAVASIVKDSLHKLNQEQ